MIKIEQSVQLTRPGMQGEYSIWGRNDSLLSGTLFDLRAASALQAQPCLSELRWPVMGCSYKLFLAISSLQRRSFSSLGLPEITAALEANGITDAEHLRFVDSADLELRCGCSPNLRQFFETLGRELVEGRALSAPARACHQNVA